MVADLGNLGLVAYPFNLMGIDLVAFDLMGIDLVAFDLVGIVLVAFDLMEIVLVAFDLVGIDLALVLHNLVVAFVAFTVMVLLFRHHSSCRDQLRMLGNDIHHMQN